MTLTLTSDDLESHRRECLIDLNTQHTTALLLFWNLSGTTRVSRYQKGKTRKVKTSLDLLEQEMVSGNGICWAISTLTNATIWFVAALCFIVDVWMDGWTDRHFCRVY